MNRRLKTNLVRENIAARSKTKAIVRCKITKTERAALAAAGFDYFLSINGFWPEDRSQWSLFLRRYDASMIFKILVEKQPGSTEYQLSASRFEPRDGNVIPVCVQKSSDTRTYPNLKDAMERVRAIFAYYSIVGVLPLTESGRFDFRVCGMSGK